MSIVLDIAWARPSVAQIQATGAVGVIRYFSTDPSKDLLASEVQAYAKAGLGTGTVYETTTGRAAAGYAAGAADARSADAERGKVGLPAGHIHYFAVDSDVSWASVAQYFSGASSVLGQAYVGVYGGFSVIEGAAAAGYHWLWQTDAWSAGRLSAHALLYQNGGTALSGGADINEVKALDWGQYPRPGGDVALNLSPEDVAAIWNHTETNKASGQQVRMGTVLSWEDYERLQLLKQLNDATAAKIAELEAKVDSLAAQLAANPVTGITDAQAAALADRIVADLAARLAQ